MIDKAAIEAHFKSQAAYQARQTHLHVDYYRIRRRMAVKLPATDMAFFHGTLGEFDGYPWPIWFVFALENRVAALAWAGEWCDNADWRALAEQDLAAMGSWSQFRQYDKPDLGVGHSGRLMWYALTHWSWLSEDCKKELHKACKQLVDEALTGLELHNRFFDNTEDLLSRDLVGKEAMLLHNIPVIGTLGAALAASCINHPRIEELHTWAEIHVTATLEALGRGFTEGVAYDGYVMDFAYCWLRVLDEERRNKILEHPNIGKGLEQCLALACPGRRYDVAEIADVESQQWPFHNSAQSYLYYLIGGAERAEYLKHYNIEWARLLSLALIRDTIDEPKTETPKPGAWDSINASILRSGWEAEDVALIASSSNCHMGHIHYDAGSIVIGHQGHWLLDDPGYQQYLRTSEREFTVGPDSHNAPVFNGQAQTLRGVTRLAHDDQDPDKMHMAFDMTQAYDSELGIKRVRRYLWLINKRLIVIADDIEAKDEKELRYNWHAKPGADWSCDALACGIHADEHALYFHCLNADEDIYSFNNISRFKGSRGHQTWQVNQQVTKTVNWWVIDTQLCDETWYLSDDNRSLSLLGHQLDVPE